MRIDPRNVDKFAALFKAGRPKKKRARSRGGQRGADEQTLGGTVTARPFKTKREREIEALEYDRRRHERYLAAREHRIARILSSSPPAAKFVKTIARLEREDKLGPIGWRTVQADLAEYAGRLGLSTAVAGDYDRFTLWEVARETVVRVCTKAGFDEDPTPYFTQPEPTTLSELQEAMGL